MRRTLLSLTLAGVLAGPAFAADPAPAPRAAPADAAAARAEIDRLTTRIVELSKQLGEDERVPVIRRKEHPNGAFEYDFEMHHPPGTPIERVITDSQRHALREVSKVRLGPKVGIGV